MQELNPFHHQTTIVEALLEYLHSLAMNSQLEVKVYLQICHALKWQMENWMHGNEIC